MAGTPPSIHKFTTNPIALKVILSSECRRGAISDQKHTEVGKTTPG
jgi:hypothetical protein